MKKIMDNLLKHYMNQDVAVFHTDEEGNSDIVAYVSVNKNLPLTKKLEEAFMKTNITTSPAGHFAGSILVHLAAGARNSG